MQSRLYDTWVARNDRMARSITRLHALGTGPVVIIIGGGHTEYGLVVINRVTAIGDTISQVNVALRKISVTPSSLSDYMAPLELEGLETAPPRQTISGLPSGSPMPTRVRNLKNR
jgi:uncharacterized iron-regulated protein